MADVLACLVEAAGAEPVLRVNAAGILAKVPGQDPAAEVGLGPLRSLPPLLTPVLSEDPQQSDHL